MITKANNDSQAQREPDYIRYDCGGCGFETLGGWRNNDVCPKCNHKPMGRTELYITPPAPVALTDEQIDAVLDSSGNIAYVIADKRERLRMFARDILRVSLQSVSGYPETLPCPVLLEPGMRFGKGIRTQTMLEALQRRAEYYAELDAMTPEERAEHDANIAAFKTMLPQPVPEGLNPEIVSLPDDWQLVPKKPNGPMLTAGYQAYMKGQHRGRFYRSYQAMLEAAPKLSEVNK
ncbi:hypothetical protein P0G01_000891 [Salmonella enterica]|nr:hypothetical protein [Salmonella enterica]